MLSPITERTVVINRFRGMFRHTAFYARGTGYAALITRVWFRRRRINLWSFQEIARADQRDIRRQCRQHLLQDANGRRMRVADGNRGAIAAGQLHSAIKLHANVLLRSAYRQGTPCA